MFCCNRMMESPSTKKHKRSVRSQVKHNTTMVEKKNRHISPSQSPRSTSTLTLHAGFRQPTTVIRSPGHWGSHTPIHSSFPLPSPSFPAAQRQQALQSRIPHRSHLGPLGATQFYPLVPRPPLPEFHQQARLSFPSPVHPYNLLYSPSYANFPSPVYPSNPRMSPSATPTQFSPQHVNVEFDSDGWGQVSNELEPSPRNSRGTFPYSSNLFDIIILFFWSGSRNTFFSWKRSAASREPRRTDDCRVPR